MSAALTNAGHGRHSQNDASIDYNTNAYEGVFTASIPTALEPYYELGAVVIRSSVVILNVSEALSRVILPTEEHV
jgi:hypothetical protein